MNNKRTADLLSFILIVFAFTAPTKICLAQAETKQDPNDKKKVVDEYKFDDLSYSGDPQKGFSAVMKLIAKAKKEKAPPEVIARLYYYAARLQRSITFNSIGKKDFERSIAILNTVLRNPDRYLANYESACWYSNCTSLLTAVYSKRGDSDREISVALEKAAKAIESETRLSKRERLYVSSRIRMVGSDVALRANDWEQAINWVNPILKQTDLFLKDEEGAVRIAMSTRQQSMFLANNGDLDKSSELIDSMCEKLAKAKGISAEKKLSLQCMLRGKHLINFQKTPTHAKAVEGWKKYNALRKQIKSDKNQKAEVLRSLANMDRLAVACMEPKKIDRAVEIVQENMTMFRKHSKLRDPSFRALWNLQDMGRTIYGNLRRQGDPRAAKMKFKVQDFVEECKTAATRKK